MTTDPISKSLGIISIYSLRAVDCAMFRRCVTKISFSFLSMKIWNFEILTLSSPTTRLCCKSVSFVSYHTLFGVGMLNCLAMFTIKKISAEILAINPPLFTTGPESRGGVIPISSIQIESNLRMVPKQGGVYYKDLLWCSLYPLTHKTLQILKKIRYDSRRIQTAFRFTGNWWIGWESVELSRKRLGMNPTNYTLLVSQKLKGFSIAL